MPSKITNKIIEFVNDFGLIGKGDSTLVAFSGGPDSLCLLDFLDKNRQLFSISVSAIYVEHNLRGAESKADGDFCEEFCREREIPFFRESINVTEFSKGKGISIEEAARELRYAKLKETALNVGAALIATGHNANDNAETVLLNVFKGKSLTSVAGIPVRRGNIIRPLLGLTREEILNYLNEEGLNYRTDSTNLKNDFQRNFIRNEIIPLLKNNLNPGLENSILKSSLAAANQTDFLKKATEYFYTRFVKNGNDTITIPIDFIDSFGIGSFYEIVKKGLREVFNLGTTFRNLIELKELVHTQTGKMLYFPQDVKAFRERDVIVFTKSAEGDKEQKIKIGEKIKTLLGTIEIIPAEKPKRSEFKTDGNAEFIDSDGVEDVFTLRRWAAGDYFFPLGMKGKKKISDFLTDAKVPTHKRKKYLVLLNGGKIVWLVGLRIDERFKIKEKTERVLKLCLN